MAPPNTQIDQCAPGVAVPRNGLLDVGGATLIANMAAIGLRDPSVVAKVVAAGGQPNYTARMFPVPATIAAIAARHDRSHRAGPGRRFEDRRTGCRASRPDATNAAAASRRAGRSDGDTIRGVPAERARAGMPSRTRSTITVFVAGAGLAILVGLVVDVLLMRWKARRQKRRQTAGSDRGWRDTADGARNVDPQNEACRRRGRDGQPMTTARPATTAGPRNGALSRFLEPPPRERTPWLLAFLCLLIPILPSYSVPPGPLKSNGSPARLIAIMLFGLAVLGFVLVQRTASTRTVRPGVVLILVYFLIRACGLRSRDCPMRTAHLWKRARHGRSSSCSRMSVWRFMP